MADKAMHGGDVQVKVENFQNEGFHFEQLFFGVGVVCDVHKLVYFRRVDLFVFPVKEQS